MSLATEFPDFPPETVPPIPKGWRDLSWKNDVCPRFIAQRLENGTHVCVWVDYANNDRRERPDGPRFGVCFCQDESNGFQCLDAILETDDWNEVLAAVAAQK